jgi:hypothetical protein
MDTDFLKSKARTAIKIYFADKQFHCGGPIPRRCLDSERYLCWVLNPDLFAAVSTAFDALANAHHPSTTKTFCGLPQDSRLVLAIMDGACRRGIGKDFAPGLMLIYLELCEGVEVCEN